MSRAKIPIVSINDGSLTGEIYHPGKPDQFNWQAGNSAASILQGVRSVWGNFTHYLNSAKMFDEYGSKLQYKAALCELKILVDIFASFHSFLMKQNIFDGRGAKQTLSITTEEKKVICDKYKIYCQNRDAKEAKLAEIRNNIGAHFANPLLERDKDKCQKSRSGIRKNLSWEEIEHLWDSIEISDFKELILSIQDYIDFASHLDIYEFFRIEETGNIRTHTPLIVCKDEDGNEFVRLGSPELLARMGIDNKEKMDTFIKNHGL